MAHDLLRSRTMPHCRSLLLVATVAAVAPLSSCDIIIGGSCPDLTEVCPDVVCDDYKQNIEGCSICECEGDDPPDVCWDDSECGAGERCDSINFCEDPPNCVEGEPCPDVCYGRCVAGPQSCSDDSDCPEGTACTFFGNAEERPSEPDKRPDGSGDSDGAAPEPIPAPDGVCLPIDCGNAEIALPECPPGTEVDFDGCNPTCRPIDFCRELEPQECASTPGCQIIKEPCFCDPDSGACDECINVERCVAVDDCGALPIEQCEQNPNCVLKAIGDGGNGTDPGSGGGGSDGAPPPGGGEEPGEPVPCPPDDPECGGFVEPRPDLVCVPRGSDGTCFADFDCNFGEVCQLTTVCGSGCTIDDDGQETCFEECWFEGGVCVPSSGTCFDLPPDQCAADPRCELLEASDAPCICDEADPSCGGCEPGAPLCVPREGACISDADCFQGQHCELVEQCPPCDPSTGEDINCAAPCFIEGRCVDGGPPPVPCNSDADCGVGSTCAVITICETCNEPDQPPPDEGGNGGGADPAPPPPPCENVCFEEQVCVQTDPVCFSDVDCNADEICDFSQLGCATPGGLIAQCPGLCVPNGQQALCQDDSQCGPGERCATELDHCLSNPDEPNSGCWTVCVDDSANDGRFCLSDDECIAADGTAESCRFNADVCLDDPSSDLAVCSGWCAGACAEVETPAVDPQTGQCVVFPDSCIPPGWQFSEACQ